MSVFDILDFLPDLKKSIFFISESESLEAQALYDFSARSVREVNFNKGDTIILYKQVKFEINLESYRLNTA